MNVDVLEKPVAIVRDHFYKGVADKKWHQQKRAVMAALTWPAMWLKTRGLPLSGAKYQEILLEVLRDIYRARASAGPIEFFPAYLEASIKSRWEEFYDRSKSFANAIDRALLAATRKPAGADDQTVDTLAEAHRLVYDALATRPRRADSQKNEPSQPSLFDA
jgi:hypothetical protein